MTKVPAKGSWKNPYSNTKTSATAFKASQNILNLLGAGDSTQICDTLFLT